MEIIVELNGKRYLLVEDIAMRSNEARLKAKYKKYGCIYQGVKEINRGGFFSNPYVVAKILVPEENVIAFNNDES